MRHVRTSIVVLTAVIAIQRVTDCRAQSQETLPPITYIRDYGADHLTDASFLAAIKSNTPDLLVLGKDAPIHHNWGPVRGTGGENQAFGQGWCIERITPEQLAEKSMAIRRLVDQLHAAGVRWVMPYICNMTIGGNHLQRTGFWEFYDHWDEYAAFGVGPRPEQDPITWMQQAADGSRPTRYQWDAPYYAPNYRWAACVNHPGWRQHLHNVVRLAAEVGYDGVYMDNACSTQCYCEICQRGFRHHLSHRLSDEEIHRELGADSLDAVHLATERGTYLWRLTAEYWTEAKLDLLRELKRTGETAGGEFCIFPNPGAWFKRAHEITRLAPVASFIQSEENGDRFGAIPGMVQQTIAGPIHLTHYNRRALEYKFTQSAANGIYVTMTTRTKGAGSPEAARAVSANRHTAALALAEAAAFGGGGCFNMHVDWDTDRQITIWRRFFVQHGDLYHPGQVWSRVAVLAFGEQEYFSGQRTQKLGLAWIANELLESRVLFDFVHESQLTRDRLRRCRLLLIPPGVRYVSQRQLDTLRAYAADGGTVIQLGDDFAEFDARCHPRENRPTDIASRVIPGMCDRDDLLRALTEELGNDPDIFAGVFRDGIDGLGVNAFALPTVDAPDRIVLHLVNYNVPLGRDTTTGPKPLGDLAVRVALPPGWRATRVRAFAPDLTPPSKLSFEQDSDIIRVDLPELTVYRAVCIEGGLR